MKKNLLLVFIFLFSFSYINSQTYRYIPDVNFRTFLRITLALPFNIGGDSLDISSTAVTSLTSINCSSKSISDLTGIQYFSNLTILNCNSNLLTSLGTLPSNLTQLYCSN
jgi:Leucine-rich repeat (LRR) protein